MNWFACDRALAYNSDEFARAGQLASLAQVDKFVKELALREVAPHLPHFDQKLLAKFRRLQDVVHGAVVGLNKAAVHSNHNLFHFSTTLDYSSLIIKFSLRTHELLDKGCVRIFSTAKSPRPH